MKKLYPLLLVVSFVLFGCGGEKNIQKETVMEEKGKIESVTGLYVEHIDKKHVVLKTEKGERVFTVPESLSAFFNELESGKTITVQYQTNDYGEIIIQEAKPLEIVMTPEENEDKNQHTEENKNNNETKKESPLGYTFELFPDYDYVHEQGIDYLLKRNSANVLSIEKLDNDSDIQKLRWHAAGDLKNFGDFVELKGEERPYPYFNEAEFVFSVKNDMVERTFIIQRIQGQLYRIVTNFQPQIPEEERMNLYKIVETIQ